MVFHSYDLNGPRLELTSADLNYQIAILKLPGFQVVRTFSLLGGEARQAVRQEWTRLQSKDGGFPVVFGVARDTSKSRWSPDGRYLAFSAAMEGPEADIYLYDSRTNGLRRLTFGEDEVL